MFFSYSSDVSLLICVLELQNVIEYIEATSVSASTLYAIDADYSLLPRHPQVSQLEGYSPDESMSFYVLKHGKNNLRRQFISLTRNFSDMIPVREALRGLSPVAVAVEYVRMVGISYGDELYCF